MDGGFAREYITIPSDGNHKVLGNESLTEITHLKLQENTIEWNDKSLASMVTIGSNDSAMVMNPSYPVTTLLANPSNLPNHGDQVLYTLQLPNGTNVIETNDENKADINQAISLLTGAKVASGATHQFTNGGNIQLNLQGINGVNQITSFGVPGIQVINSQLAGNATIAPAAQQLSALNQSANTAPVAIQQLPQNFGVAQFFIAGGQLVQGVQGAQLVLQPANGLITTNQQIVAVPYNQLPTGQQLFAGPNGQLMTTSFNNVQTFASHPQTATGNGLQPQTLFANNLPVLGLNQNQSIQPVFTSSNGQILTISPQLVGQQSPGVVQVYGSNGPLNADKLYQPINANGSQGTISNQTVLPNQTHIQVATSSDSIQIQSQTIQKSACTEIVQQTSSPSITSTESSTPISQTSANTVDGINLEEIKEFAKLFKIRRLSLGLTQTQVGQALNVAEGPAYSQSAICRFEKLDITPKSAQKIKPVLERWMKEAEERYKNGAMHLTDFIGTEPSKKRKRRTSFTPQALEVLNRHFENNTHPSGTEMTDLADKLNYDREVVRVWFCNKRQTLKNTVKKVKSEFL